MNTDTSTAFEQPTLTAPTPKPQRNKVMRIATMTKQLLHEVHTHPLDAASVERLQTIDNHIIDELLADLTPDLRDELQRLTLPLTHHTDLSDAELRLAHAQLVGWLQGLLKTTRTSLSEPHAIAANDSKTVQTASHHFDRRHVEPCSPAKLLPDDSASSEDNPAIRSARQTLLTAIIGRITQQRLTAAQAAVVLHLTGPRVTQLLQANITEFTLDELVNLLPALDLILQVVPASEREVRSSV
ncbi:MAG: hypothetical protein QOK02_2209 [Mycobacterium sp.]|jgi:predicted XRE-type DNA-binding protein|nr:hypothetical protein [Mycobacterium sp.]